MFSRCAAHCLRSPDARCRSSSAPPRPRRVAVAADATRLPPSRTRSTLFSGRRRAARPRRRSRTATVTSTGRKHSTTGTCGCRRFGISSSRTFTCAARRCCYGGNCGASVSRGNVWAPVATPGPSHPPAYVQTPRFPSQNKQKNPMQFSPLGFSLRPSRYWPTG